MNKKILVKSLVLCFGVLGLAYLLPQSAMGKAAGTCVTCHTMHNSQDGAAVDAGGPYGALTNETGCIGCHTGSTSLGSVIPYVMSSGTESNILAGGSFDWVKVDTAAAHKKGHNVDEVVATDDNIAGTDTTADTPPGWTQTGFTLNGTLGLTASDSVNWTTQLTCAGSYGCHGTHGDGVTEVDPFTAISGAHHGDDSTIDGSTVVKSFRFLLGVKGTEDNDWEYETIVDHNLYYGEARSSETATDKASINYLCAECHGNFHSGAGTLGVDDTWGAAWLRHPTDIALPTTSEYAGYTPISAYDATVPVAWTSPGATAAASTGPVVACLSCHRAHGSAYDDLLRWDYDTCVAGSNDAACGCFVCHTTKDAG